MKLFIATSTVFVLVGCAPIQITSAPEPSPQEMAKSREIQSRVIPVDIDTVMIKIVDILYDNGFLVRSANSRLGLVSFCQQRFDPQQNLSITMEGSAIFKSTGPNSTQVRLLLSGNWEGTSGGGGTKSIVVSSVGGVKDIEQDQYKKLLDLFDARLRDTKN